MKKGEFFAIIALLITVIVTVIGIGLTTLLSLSGRIDNLYSRMDDLNGEISESRSYLSGRIDTGLDTVNKRIDTMSQRIDKLYLPVGELPK